MNKIFQPQLPNRVFTFFHCCLRISLIPLLYTPCAISPHHGQLGSGDQSVAFGLLLFPYYVYTMYITHMRKIIINTFRYTHPRSCPVKEEIEILSLSEHITYVKLTLESTFKCFQGSR